MYTCVSVRLHALVISSSAAWAGPLGIHARPLESFYIWTNVSMYTCVSVRPHAFVSSSHMNHTHTCVCRWATAGRRRRRRRGAALIPRVRGVRAARAEGWGRVLLKQCPAGPSAMPVRLQPHGHYPLGLSVADWAGRRDML